MKEGRNRRNQHRTSNHRSGDGKVSIRSRAVIILLVSALALIVLRPVIAQQSEKRAGYFLGRGHNKRAITHYKRALLLDPNSCELHSILGYAYFREEQWGDALDAYEEAIKLGADDKETYLEAGVASFREKDFDKAAYYSGKAAEVDPADVLIKNLEAASYEKLGETEKAIAISREILKQAPNFKSAKERLKRLLSKEEKSK